MLWVSSNVGIDGNDPADQLAFSTKPNNCSSLFKMAAYGLHIIASSYATYPSEQSEFSPTQFCHMATMFPLFLFINSPKTWKQLSKKMDIQTSRRLNCWLYPPSNTARLTSPDRTSYVYSIFFLRLRGYSKKLNLKYLYIVSMSNR